MLLMEVGCLGEASQFLQRAVARDPKLPVVWGQLAMSLHFGGHDKQSDLALGQAFLHSPAHPFLWHVRYTVLIGGKHYVEAAAFVRSADQLPNGIVQPVAELFAKIADALAKGKANAATPSELACFLCDGLENVPTAVTLLAECGAAAAVFDMLDAYFLGGLMNGQRAAPPGPSDERLSFMLFAPAVVALHKDPRYASLLARTGLETYWRASSTQPDFRRSGMR